MLMEDAIYVNKVCDLTYFQVVVLHAAFSRLFFRFSFSRKLYMTASMTFRSFEVSFGECLTTDVTKTKILCILKYYMVKASETSSRYRTYERRFNLLPEIWQEIKHMQLVSQLAT